MTKQTKDEAVTITLSVGLEGLTAAEKTLIENNAANAIEAGKDAIVEYLSRAGYQAGRLVADVVVQQVPKGKVPYDEARGKIKFTDFADLERRALAHMLVLKEEPGEPLRRFVRGFLRDHLGWSKIMAHHAADLFMKRWANRRDYDPRYGREDKHTLEATFDRRAIAEVDREAGITQADKVVAMATSRSPSPPVYPHGYVEAFARR